MEQCIYKKAHCAPHWESLTHQQQEALADKYKTSVQNLGRAYQGVVNKTKDELMVAYKQHEARKKVMQEDFRKTAETVAAKFGCNVDCLHKCGEQNDGNCFERCECGKGVITIEETYVNTFGIVKREYGDIQNLNNSQIRAVNDAISKF